MIYMQILPVMILRFGTYIDVAAPIFGWTFFHEIVLQTLVEAQTGVYTLQFKAMVQHEQNNLHAYLDSLHA